MAPFRLKSQLITFFNKLITLCQSLSFDNSIAIHYPRHRWWHKHSFIWTWPLRFTHFILMGWRFSFLTLILILYVVVLNFPLCKHELFNVGNLVHCPRFVWGLEFPKDLSLFRLVHLILPLNDHTMNNDFDYMVLETNHFLLFFNNDIDEI